MKYECLLSNLQANCVSLMCPIVSTRDRLRQIGLNNILGAAVRVFDIFTLLDSHTACHDFMETDFKETLALLFLLTDSTDTNGADWVYAKASDWLSAITPPQCLSLTAPCRLHTSIESLHSEFMTYFLLHVIGPSFHQLWALYSVLFSS